MRDGEDVQRADYCGEFDAELIAWARNKLGEILTRWESDARLLRHWETLATEVGTLLGTDDDEAILPRLRALKAENAERERMMDEMGAQLAELEFETVQKLRRELAAAHALIASISREAERWTRQPNDEDAEQQIEDGKKILGMIERVSVSEGAGREVRSARNPEGELDG
ncbi:hypothetical protein NDR87_18795 [Nocardia sp. CDC159]|uniref:Uncharacterized protein n=1 Tax=Nocardia pulmonis TaxID=2951408 RepID=A0A9X2J0T0_9NOCA|nr:MULTISPECIES: hypothetical protein [Nocardia]MCM6776261.1 hypothetical protein [Nocardia pulmonis]MCM6788413.1 hypothetical protein [Nocardia sp. CDC159]